MTDHLPERQAVIDLYDGELDTAHTQMCSTDYRECCQLSHDEFVKALDDLIRACEDRVLDGAREAISAERINAKP